MKEKSSGAVEHQDAISGADIPQLQAQKAGNYIKRMSLHYCLFLYYSQSR